MKQHHRVLSFIALFFLAAALIPPMALAKPSPAENEPGATATTDPSSSPPEVATEPKGHGMETAATAPTPTADSTAPQGGAVQSRAQVEAHGGFTLGSKRVARSWPSSHHPPRAPGPISEPVRFVHAFTDGGAALETERGRVVDADTRAVLVDAGQGRLLCSAGRRPQVACLAERLILSRSGRLLGAELWLHESQNRRQRVTYVGPQGLVMALGVHVDDSGPSLLYSVRVDGRSPALIYWFSKGAARPVDLAVSDDTLRELGSDRPSAAVRFVTFQGQPYAVYRYDGALLAKPAAMLTAGAPPIVISEDPESIYEFRAVVGQDGWLYVFFHDPETKSIHVAASPDGYHFSVRQLDGGETGTQMEALAAESGVYVAYYYYQDQFDRGVRLMGMRNGAPMDEPCTLARQESHNVGWGLGLAASSSGAAWLTYFDPVEEGARQRVWSRQSLQSYRENHCDYGSDPLRSSSDLSLNIGVGVWYDTWMLDGSSIEASDNDGVAVGATEYEVDPAILSTMAVEARYGQYDFGLRYAKDLMRRELKRLDRLSRFSGYFKISDLLLGHDLRLEGAFGHYTGSMEPGDGVEGEAGEFDTRYADVHLYAVNTWRIKYGLAFTRYELPVPVHVYTAGTDETQYTYAGSYIGNGSIYTASLMLGGSKLDYISKYENHYNDFFVDGAGGIGIAVTALDEPIETPAGSVDTAQDLILRGRLMAGWLFMHRFRSAAGLGFYLRPAYLVDAFLTGLMKPGDRTKEKDETLEPDAVAMTGISALHHGPWFDLGLLW